MSCQKPQSELDRIIKEKRKENEEKLWERAKEEDERRRGTPSKVLEPIYRILESRLGPINRA